LQAFAFFVATGELAACRINTLYVYSAVALITSGIQALLFCDELVSVENAYVQKKAFIFVV
jgi:hypothetical protein